MHFSFFFLFLLTIIFVKKKEQGQGKNNREGLRQSYIHQVLQTIQMKLILLCVWAEPAVLGSAKIALKFKHEI